MSKLVIFVVPFYKPSSGEFLEPMVRMSGVRLAVITQGSAEDFPRYLAERVPIVRVREITSAQALVEATTMLVNRFGRPHRILAINEQVQVPVAVVREVFGIEGMTSESIAKFRDKSKMKNAFREAGVPCARHVAARSAQEAKEFVAKVGFPVCVKPIDGAAAQGTYKVPSMEILEDILRSSGLDEKNSIQIEEFVRGDEFSFETLSVDGQPLWHSLTHYRPTPLKVVRNPWIQWTILSPRDLDVPLYDDIKEAGEKALTCLGMKTGLTHLEWFRRPDGSLAINEVGARPPGAQIVTLMNRAHDMDLFTIWARMMVWNVLDPIPKRKYATGAVFLRGLGGHAVKSVDGLGILEELGDMVTDMSIPETGQPASNTYEGEGYVLVRHPETKRVQEALDAIIAQVRVRMF